ncbi:MAG: FGGY family carbohydrate kinase [Firmicutes bacterium]|nr:FGGY family carbohydrate kinase [Bacillota bacterium]
MTVLGLDIGTTSICAAVTDGAGALFFCESAQNDSGNTVQDPERIWEICTGLLDRAFAACPDIAGIGLCGQMHGVLYLDARGRPVSPLYTWQDGSGNGPYNDNETYAQALSARTGHAMASGFGCTTLFVHAQRGEIPPGAAQLCTIHDYTAMRLCGLARPLMHSSDAASFGLFDLRKLEFDREALRAAGLPEGLFPKVTADFDVLGAYKGRPVTVAIGDNQASFLGAAEEPARTVLVNVGTGSQCSLATGYVPPARLAPGAELRPLCGEQYLYVGSALCGGRAFALAKDFFTQCARFLGMEDVTDDAVYAAMDKLLKENPPPSGARLRVDTRFAGTRRDPSVRGSVTGIGTDNFTPGHLLRGMVAGMAEELYDFYRESGETRGLLVGAGNGLRKNAALRQALEGLFGMPLTVPPCGEEAARGAAKVAAGL